MLAATEEIRGETAVEGLLQAGLEVIVHPSVAGPAVFVRTLGHQLVESTTISRHHVLDIAYVLQPALDLERAGTGIGQLFKVVDLGHILERQQVAVVLDNPAIGIHKVELHAAELRTLTTVGRALEAVLRGIADARIAHAEGTVDKDLELHVGHGTVDGTYLVSRQLTGQHGPGEAQTAQPSHLLGRAGVALRRGMEHRGMAHGIERHPAHGERGHVLHQQGIDASLSQFGHQLLHGLQLFLVDDGVDGDIDLGTILMGIAAQGPDVGYRVAGRRAGTEAVGPDIHSIGPMTDGSHATFKVLGRCEKF